MHRKSSFFSWSIQRLWDVQADKAKDISVRFFFEAHPLNGWCDLRSLISLICTWYSPFAVVAQWSVSMFAMGFEIYVGTFLCRCSVFTTNSMYLPHKAYHRISYLTSKSTNPKHKQSSKLCCSPPNHHNASLMNNSSAGFRMYLYVYIPYICMYTCVTCISH